MISEQIMAIIDTIAQKLGVAAEAVYPMLLKQAEVFEATYHVTLWILCVSAILFVASLIWTAIALVQDSDTLPFAVALILIFGVIVLIMGLIAGIDLKEYFTAIYNPDMWAVEYVARLLQ